MVAGLLLFVFDTEYTHPAHSIHSYDTRQTDLLLRHPISKRTYAQIIHLSDSFYLELHKSYSNIKISATYYRFKTCEGTFNIRNSIIICYVMFIYILLTFYNNNNNHWFPSYCMLQ